MTQEGSPGPQVKEMGSAHGAQAVDGTEGVSHPVPETARLQATRTGRRTREPTGGVGASARGVSRGREARRACSVPHLSGRGGRPGLLGPGAGERAGVSGE